MTGRTATGILVTILSVWWMVASWRWWRDPSRMHPGHWRYAGIYRRIRGLRGSLQRHTDSELTNEEIKDYAVKCIILSILAIAFGLYLVIESLVT